MKINKIRKKKQKVNINQSCISVHVPVGNFLRITAKSATGWPSNIVPFLCEPTARTSSTPWKENNIITEMVNYTYMQGRPAQCRQISTQQIFLKFFRKK